MESDRDKSTRVSEISGYPTSGTCEGACGGGSPWGPAFARDYKSNPYMSPDMKVYDAYRLAIETGMEHDPRSDDELERVLDKANRDYESLPDDEKEFFDTERLWNPYSDCRFSWGEEIAKETDAERILWGIDITPAEILIADRLREKGERIDAVVAHHPLGRSRNIFPEVMWMQTDIFNQCGVPINVAEDLMRPRMNDVLRGVMGDNFNRSAEAAEMFGIPLFNVHSAADNMVQEYVEDIFYEARPRTVGDIVDTLMKEPEYRDFAKLNDPPRILVGNKDNRCGEIVAKMTGGTSAPDKMYAELAKAGVGTVVCMHIPESGYKACVENHINVVISGHMASDSLGVNLICDEWERHGIETVGFSGFHRHSRNRDVREPRQDNKGRRPARLLLRPGDARGQGRRTGRAGIGVPSAVLQLRPVHRVRPRARRIREDRHRAPLLRGHGQGVLGFGEGAGHGDRELQDAQQRVRGDAGPREAFRQGVPGPRVLRR